MMAQEVGPWDGPIVRERLAWYKLRHDLKYNHSSKRVVIFDKLERVVKTVGVFNKKLPLIAKRRVGAV